MVRIKLNPAANAELAVHACMEKGIHANALNENVLEVLTPESKAAINVLKSVGIPLDSAHEEQAPQSIAADFKYLVSGVPEWPKRKDLVRHLSTHLNSMGHHPKVAEQYVVRCMQTGLILPE